MIECLLEKAPIEALGAIGEANARTWRTVFSMSAVSVLVMDWTMMGASPPTVTLPILTAVVLCLQITGILSGSKSKILTDASVEYLSQLSVMPTMF